MHVSTCRHLGDCLLHCNKPQHHTVIQVHVMLHVESRAMPAVIQTGREDCRQALPVRKGPAAAAAAAAAAASAGVDQMQALEGVQVQSRCAAGQRQSVHPGHLQAVTQN